MADIHVRFGNRAPASTVLREASEEEAVQAGPLGQRQIAGDETKFFVLDLVPIEGLPFSVTHAVVPHAYSANDAVADLHLAYMGQHSAEPPGWVHCENEHVAWMIAQHFEARTGHGVPILGHDDLEKVLDNSGPRPIGGGAIQAVGRDLWAQALGDTGSDYGTSTGVTATTLTDTTKAWTTNQWAGKELVSGQAVATILSNTATVLTIARWETPGARSGAAASTPATGSYVIASGNNPALWMAFTANNTAPSTGGADTTLAGEITTAGSGFLRQQPVYAHTAGASTYTLTLTATATSSDTFPGNINKIGVFQAQNGGRLLFETLLSATFTYNQAGDNVQVTDTVTGT